MGGKLKRGAERGKAATLTVPNAVARIAGKLRRLRLGLVERAHGAREQVYLLVAPTAVALGIGILEVLVARKRLGYHADYSVTDLAAGYRLQDALHLLSRRGAHSGLGGRGKDGLRKFLATVGTLAFVLGKPMGLLGIGGVIFHLSSVFNV